MQSSEYCQDLPAFQTWLNANYELFNYISHNLPMIDPQMYTIFTSINRYLPPDFTRMTGSLHGLAINQSMVSGDTKLKSHLDWKDINYCYNTVLSWGEFGCRNLTFWQLNVIYEVFPDDCLLFMGSVIFHQVSDITSSERNSLDLFCHKSTID